MCDKHIAGQLRDREFDSLVESDFNKAAEQTGQSEALANAVNYRPAQPVKADPFEAINKAWSGVIQAIAVGDVQAAQERASAAIDETLQGYYLGRGNFAHERFLSDLQEAKGSPLDESEYRFFGRIVGDWTGTKAAAETNAALERGDLAEAEAIFAAVLG